MSDSSKTMPKDAPHWISGRATLGKEEAEVCSICDSAVRPGTEREHEAKCWRDKSDKNALTKETP